MSVDTKQFITCIQNLRNEDGVYILQLDSTNPQKTWAIVAGWQDGFEETPSDSYSKDKYRICIKLAYQPSYYMLQSDYNLDWTMPDRYGMVDDTEIPIFDNTNLETCISHLVNRFMLLYKNS